MTNNIVKTQSSALTEVEKTRAIDLAKGINLNDDNAILNFGISTQKKLGDHSTKILKEVKTKDTEEIGSLLGGILSQVKSYDISQSGFEKALSNMPIIGKFYQLGDKIMTQHKTVESNLVDMTERLDKSRVSLSIDNQNLKSLYDETLNYIRENKVNVEALKYKIVEINEQINTIKFELTQESDPIKEQELNRLTNILNIIEKKIHNMSIFDASAYQSIPTLMMMGDNNHQLMSNIENVVTNVIPLWKTQIATALYLEKQKKVIDLNNAIYDTTNKLMVNNSKTIKENTIKVARHMERDVIDVETFKTVNKNFIDTIQEVTKIRSEGVESRKKVAMELNAVKEEMSKAIMSLSDANENSNSVIKAHEDNDGAKIITLAD